MSPQLRAQLQAQAARVAAEREAPQGVTNSADVVTKAVHGVTNAKAKRGRPPVANPSPAALRKRKSRAAKP